MAKKDNTKMPKKENQIDKVAGVVSKYKGLLITIICVAVVGLIGYAVYEKVSTSVKDKYLSEIEKAEYALLTGTSALSDSELAPYYEATLKSVEPYTSKGGIVGARANLLKAEVEFRNKNFEAARTAYIVAASKVKKTYLAPICYFNAATACEELNDAAKAIEYYTLAAEDKNFADPTRAWFAVGRLKENSLDYVGAKEAYEKITAKDNTQDPWHNLAKSRLISMQIDGKIE